MSEANQTGDYQTANAHALNENYLQTYPVPNQPGYQPPNWQYTPTYSVKTSIAQTSPETLKFQIWAMIWEHYKRETSSSEDQILDIVDKIHKKLSAL